MPTKNEQAIWRDVERELGHAVPAAVREFCRRMDYLDMEWWENGREEAVATIMGAVRSLEGTVLRSEAEPTRAKPSVEIPDGERWQLLYDLGRYFERKYHGTPVAGEIHGFDPLTLEHFEDTASYPASQRIRVEFDSGMNLSTVFAILQREFREEYRPKGLVRTTRPLGERAIALVRFVCLDSQEGLTWRERLPLWNERFPQWRFKDVRAFQSAFRRAEIQLTGNRGGLEVLYITLEEYERKMRKWREFHLARLRAKGTTREQMLASKEES